MSKEKKVIKEIEETEEQSVNVVREIMEMVILLAVAIVFVFFFLKYVGQRTDVDGSSMYDTLEDGDNLWVDKLSYRFKDPERFDIVVFLQDTDTFYIKRIIGLPGETVRIEEDGTIYINDKPLTGDVYGYETISPNMIGRADKDVVLGEDEYFVMGDNRNGSEDSRFYDVGNVNREQFEGKAVLRICIAFKVWKD